MDDKHQRFARIVRGYVRLFIIYLIVTGVLMYYQIVKGYAWLEKPSDYVTVLFNVISALMCLYSNLRAKVNYKRANESYANLLEARELILKEHPQVKPEELPLPKEPIRWGLGSAISWLAMAFNLALVYVYLIVK